MSKSLYATLGVDADASADEIKKPTANLLGSITLM